MKRFLSIILLFVLVMGLPVRSYASVSYFQILENCKFAFVHRHDGIGGVSKGGAAFVFGPEVFFAPIIMAAIWHIPAWSQAKANHTEAAYQAQEMFPQQLFDKLPGGTPGRSVTGAAKGNGGNFEGGMSN